MSAGIWLLGGATYLWEREAGTGPLPEGAGVAEGPAVNKAGYWVVGSKLEGPTAW